MASIEFRYENAMADRVGSDGITRDDLDAKRGADAVRAFRARVESGEVGFPNLPDDKSTANAIVEFADSLRKQIDDVLIVGIGGSALGPYALDVAMRGPHPVQVAHGKSKTNRPRLVVLDNIDPGFIAGALANLNPKRTAVCVIAKSGSTAETISTFLIVREWITKAMKGKARGRIIAITGPKKGDLRQIATEEQYPTFSVPENIGGRYSVFCPVGLVPAALLGFDIHKMLRGAAKANEAGWSDSLSKNQALTSALVHHALDTKHGKHIEVVYAYSSYLWGSAFWYRQLWAESLGKRVDREGNVVHTGQTPIAALGVTDQHSQSQLYMEGPNDKLITFWKVTRPRVDVKIPKDFKKYDSTSYLGGKTMGQLFHAERIATAAALTRMGRPNCLWTLPTVNEETIGYFFQTLEFQTAYAGELYGINAFDQPGVELSKELTYGLMGRKGFEKFAKGLK